MMEAEGSMGAPSGLLHSQHGEPSSTAGSMGAPVMGDAAMQRAPYTEESVLEMIRCLNSSPSRQGQGPSSAAANEYLTEFQRDPSAWGICISILNKHIHSQQQPQLAATSVISPEALHFSAQTLAAQARAGFPQQLSALLRGQEPQGGNADASDTDFSADSSRVYAELRDGLLQLVFAFRDAPLPVLRQLCIALSSALIFECSSGDDGAPSGGGPYLAPVLRTLGHSAGTEGVLPLLELLTILPEELCTKRVALSENQRLACLASCMTDNTAEVLQLIQAVFVHAQATHDESAPQQRRRWRAVLHAAVRALQSWLAATGCWLQLQEPEEGIPSSDGLHKAMATLHLVLQRVMEGRMFGPLLLGVTSDDLESLQLASECVVTIIAAASKLEELATTTPGSNRFGEPLTSPTLLGPLKTNSPVVTGEEKKKMERLCFSMITCIVKAYGEGCQAALTTAKGQPGGIAAFDVERLQVFAQGITELAKTQIPGLLASMAEAEARLEEGEATPPGALGASAAAALQPYIDNICELAGALLKHPSFEVKEVAVTFFRNLLSHMVVLVEEERRLRAWRDRLRSEVAAASAAKGRRPEALVEDGPPRDDERHEAHAAAALREIEDRYDRNLDAMALREPLLSRLFYPFAEAAVQQLRPPVVSLLREEMEYEGWQTFRAELAATVTEAGVLLDLDAPCNAVAAQLLRELQDFQHMGVGDTWLDIEARLFFVATVGNRIRLKASSFSPDDSSVDNVTAAPVQGAPCAAQQADDLVVQVLQLLPQLPFPVQQRFAAPSTSSSATEEEVVGLFLHSAAARTIAWLSPRVIPQHHEMFAPLFSLLASKSLQFVGSLPEAPKESNIYVLRHITEALLVEGLSSLVASAAAFIPSPGREKDVHTLLNALIGAFTSPGISLDNSSALVQTAGYVISCLDGPRIRTLSSELLQSLAAELDRNISDPRSSGGMVKRSVALFFSALQAVHPAEDYCPPPPSQTFEPLSRETANPEMSRVVKDASTLSRSFHTSERSLRSIGAMLSVLPSGALALCCVTVG